MSRGKVWNWVEDRMGPSSQELRSLDSCILKLVLFCNCFVLDTIWDVKLCHAFVIFSIYSVFVRHCIGINVLVQPRIVVKRRKCNWYRFFFSFPEQNQLRSWELSGGCKGNGGFKSNHSREGFSLMNNWKWMAVMFFF